MIDYTHLVLATFISFCVIIKIFEVWSNKSLNINSNPSDVDNPFSLENSVIIKQIDNDINSNLSLVYNKSINVIIFLKWIILYIKNCNNVNPYYFQFKIYDIFYDEETHIFERELLSLIENYDNILDFGCGTCKIWRRNKDFLQKHNIHCIDLDKNILSYPKYLLKNEKNIVLTNENILDLEMKYDVVLFSEVIMQLEKPEKLIKYIVDKNPHTKIIACHTIFTENISKIITPIKNGIIKHIPILKTIYGKALTYEQTIEIFTRANCKLTETIKIYDNKIIFVFEKK